MRKHQFILIVAATLLFTLEMAAQPINSAQALKNAQAFLQAKGISMGPRSMRRAPSANATGDFSPYYVFNLDDNEGFVIASGDYRAYPVLAYSDSGSMNLDSLPDNVKYWLGFYEAQIKALKDTETTGARPRRLPSKVVEPMLTTKWNQGIPYNLSCPVNQNGRRCLTGCVATAMAQVMFYHRKHSTRQVMKDISGYHAEVVDNVTVDAILKGSAIDWDNMKDEYIGNNYTEEQAMAVANLMFYCGGAVWMQYGAEESLAMINGIPDALVRYFDYDDDVRELQRDDNYTDAEWESMVYDELAKGYPIPYAGGGHAYVIDGCDADGYVHVNWGWGGDRDGYFLLSPNSNSLNGYSDGQIAILGAIPYGSFPRLTTQSIALNSATIVEELSSMTTFPVSFTMKVANQTDTQNSFEQVIALYKNGNLQSVVGTLGNISNLEVNGCKNVDVSLDLDATLADGVYKLVPLSREAGADKWRKNGNYDQLLTLTINNGRARIVVGIPPSEGDIIAFADAQTKLVCVENWDINGDGELSRQEAAKVTNLKKVFRNNEDITSFDELQYFTGLTTIGEEAFRSCRLTSIVIPSNVVSIGESAFYNASLRSITIPASVREIGRNAFNYNFNLEDIQVEASNTCYDSRDNCHALMETATNTLLTGCKNTIIPDGTMAIGEKAFNSCSNLTSIPIPGSVTSIGAEAFSNCYKLQSIHIPEGVTDIGDKAFYCCHSLTSISFPRTIRTLAGSAFMGCKNLASIRVDTNNPYYDSRDNCNAVMEKATNKLVMGCKNTIIPQSTEGIGDYAFYVCHFMPTVVIPSKVTSIGDYAFNSCNNLFRIELPEGLENIGKNAFYNARDLTTVILPSTLTSIGTSAFNSCENLASVEVRMENPIDISSGTFSSQNIATLYVPWGSASSYQSAAEWKKFKKIVEGSIPYRDIIDFADVDAKHVCIEHWDKDGDREFTKEEAAAVTDLGTAFRQNSPLAIEEGYAENLPYHPRYFNELQYFTGLTSIGDEAFAWSKSLKSVTLPPNLLAIESDAFAMCENLQSIDIPESVTQIGSMAFTGCSSLTSIVIPQGVTEIGESAFDSYGLTTVVVKRMEPVPISEWTFSNYDNATLYVPKGSRDAYKEAEN